MKILILGGNGMIGHKMYQVLSQDFPDTWVILRQKFGDLAAKSVFNHQRVIDTVDLSNLRNLSSILNDLNPDVIINAAGITIRRGINNKLSYSILVNSVLPHFLNEWISGKDGKRLIHFSTDCVFSGKSGSYTDEAEPDATDYYGKTKALGEVKTMQTLTLRGSMIGRELENYTELLEWFLAQKGKTIKGFSNVIYSGITTVRMAKLVKMILHQFPLLSGIYNVSSVPISKYDLLLLFRKTFELDVEIEKDESYSSRKDLISEKFFHEIGIPSPQWSDLVTELKADSELYRDYYKK